MATDWAMVDRVVMTHGSRDDFARICRLARERGASQVNASAYWRWALATLRDTLEAPPNAPSDKRPAESQPISGTSRWALDGQRLREARVAAGLGQGALAKKLGYGHRSSVGNIEVGRAPLGGVVLAWVIYQEGRQ